MYTTAKHLSIMCDQELPNLRFHLDYYMPKIHYKRGFALTLFGGIGSVMITFR